MIEEIVIDTDVVSFLIKGDSRADLYRDHLEGKAAIISFMCVAELEHWALTRAWGRSPRVQMEAWLDQFRVSAPDRALCREWAAVKMESRTKARPIETADAWMAATARHLGLPLVTHNRRHYEWLSNLEILSARPGVS